MNAADKTTVAVLYGGQSTEHAVSCISAGAIIDNLDPDRFEVIPVGITDQGVWVPGSTDVDELQAHGDSLPYVKESDDHIQPVFGSQLSSKNQTQKRQAELRYIAGPHSGELFAAVDVVFPVLHGINGEDGTIQGVLDLIGVPYVGNGVLPSAAGMDKEFTKRLAREEKIPTGAEVVLYENRNLNTQEQQILGLPVFVKPARGGSSIGISKVDSWDEFPAAAALAFEHDEKIIVEAMLDGAEVECGVLQYPDGSTVASVPAMLRGTEDGDEGFYGFDAKYLDNTVSAAIPAPLGEELTEQVRSLAVKTFDALGCQGLARVDFFVTDSGPVLNEINTMPGFTPISMYPKMFLNSGLSYPELLSILILEALKN